MHPRCSTERSIPTLSRFVSADFSSRVAHLIIPKNEPIHKSPANQFTNPTQPPIYCGFGLLRWEQTDKSTIEGGVSKPVHRQFVDRPMFWDDEVGRLLLMNMGCCSCILARQRSVEGHAAFIEWRNTWKCRRYTAQGICEDLFNFCVLSLEEWRRSPALRVSTPSFSSARHGDLEMTAFFPRRTSSEQESFALAKVNGKNLQPWAIGSALRSSWNASAQDLANVALPCLGQR